MKILKYFPFLFIVFTLSSIFMILAIKFVVEIVFFFKTGNFLIDYYDIKEAVGLGAVFGIFCSCIYCVIYFFQNRRNKF
ncbi:hypothetical protein ACP179_22935 [Xenorhabdus stockiae]|uniref:hypothetical protein n=1 Tax=Xenorhabdus stockiae TaxID=351614 RepID=UPI003CE7DEC4